MPYIPPYSPLNSWPLLVIVVTYIHVYIPKYVNTCNPLNLYSVTCMHVFRAGYLVLSKRFVRSSLGKTIYPTISILWLPTDLCAGLRLHEHSPMLFSMSVGVLV